MIELKLFLLMIINQLLYICECKYSVTTDVTQESTTNSWLNQISNTELVPCSGNGGENYIGQQNSLGVISWKKTYNLPLTNKLYVYIEYSLSGNWLDDELLVYANNLKVFSTKIKFQDSNKFCDQRFSFDSQIYFIINMKLNILDFEFKVNNNNIGLYIKNIIFVQQLQRGRDEILPFTQTYGQCNQNLQYYQYYCRCASNLVFQNNQCIASCGQNYLYDPQQNACYAKQNCSSCVGTQTNLVCDPGYYKYQDSDITKSNCVNRCPNSQYQDEVTKVCKDMASYLSTTENGGYPIDHIQFFQNIPQFLHLFNYNDMLITLKSIPNKSSERTFFFQNNQFLIGSYDTFKTQTIYIQANVKNAQYKLKFIAIAHFIDFYPKSIEITINNVKQQPTSIKLSSINKLQTSIPDYIAYFDFTWTRTEQYPLNQNIILIQIEQPSQSNKYIGYFYLEDIHIYQYQCQTGCNNCFTYAYCTPCLFPANKNPTDCSCLTGYVMKDNQCIACPNYCTTCVTEGVCVDCLASTKRINSPQCDQCPVNYYVDSQIANCQPCQSLCYKCTIGTACDQCLNGYFRSQTNQCLLQCPDGQFNDSSNINDPKCSICDSNCNKCQTDSTTCTDCNGLATLVSGHCYLCSEGEYLSGTTCMPCINGCSICSSNICITCQDSYFYKSSTNECLQTCDPGFFGNTITKTCDECNSSCLTCSDGTDSDCITCHSDKLLNLVNVYSGKCKTFCLPGLYQSAGQCQKCWKGCSTCNDSTQACLTCASQYYRLKSTGWCYEICPDGYYNNYVGQVCSLCNSKCKTCNGFSELNCVSCNNPLSYFQNQCLTECYDGYGSVNYICRQCTANCKKCFGTKQNECLECMNGFYSFNSQCYVKCPRSFFGVRPQYVCKCIYQDCVTCITSEFYLENVCYSQCPTGYYGYNGLCIKCDITCGTCFGEEQDECTSCNSGLILYKNTCITACLGNLYHDVITNECKECNSECLACTGPQKYNCKACPDEKLLTVENTCKNQCTDGSYPVLNEKQCYPCHLTCKTCFGPSIDNCLSCINLFQANECVNVCSPGFTINATGTTCDSDFPLVVGTCSYQCKTCELAPRFCKSCNGNRSPNPPNCDCESGYFDDGVNANCIKCENKCLTCKGLANLCLRCKGDRLLPTCKCPEFYYDDGESVNCIKCQDNCKTCDATGCTSCLGDRINNPSCICPHGYFDNYQTFCQQCSLKCVTCSGSAELCESCSGIRIENPICQCPHGYFEDSDEECQLCDQSCKDCNKEGCLSCFGNRIGPINGECKCGYNGISRFRIGSSYCTDCSLGVPYFGLNEEFTGFDFEFGGSAIYIVQENTGICKAFFESETLQKLGQNPICTSDFSVIFGQNPTIKVGDIIQLKLSFLLQGCNYQFLQILPMPLSIPSSIDQETHKPNVKFRDLGQQNICLDLVIKFEELFYNGKQNLTVISWDQYIPAVIDSKIQSILDSNTLNKSDTLTFPSKTLQSNVRYKFGVKVESFALLQNIVYFQIQATSQSKISFYPNSNINQFYRFDRIQIQSEITYSNCIEKVFPQQTLFYEIKLKNTQTQLLNGTLTENLEDGFVYYVPLSFNQYYFNFTNPYILTFNAKLIRFDYTVSVSQDFEIYIIQSSPILTIAGGNRMIGYTEKLFLNTTIIDKDLTLEEASQMNYECYWSCQDIVNGTACIDSQNQTIEFDQKCNQYIPPGTFVPYQVFNFEVAIIKEEIMYSTKISIQLIEIDLPDLVVYGINQSETHNYYDEFIFKLVYPGINPDLLMYAGALIYDSVVQATFQFYYLEFKFKTQDFFTNLQESFGNSLKLRVSVYDPRFILPSLNTQMLIMNIPPQNCALEMNYNEGFIEFIEAVQVSIVNCTDINLPLQYSVWVFPNESIYQSDLIQSNFYNYIMLEPYQQTNKFHLYLSYLNDKTQMLVFHIQDSNGGVINITQAFDVRQYEQIDQSTFRNYEALAIDLDQKLIGYNLITERLKTINNLYEYKQDLFQRLIALDKNQSFLSNQTDILYRSISKLLSQNLTLLKSNEDILLNQINYRLNLAYSQLINYFNLQKLNKLTSVQNIEKTNYLSQYYTFSDILSSCLNYRVQQNLTSTDIQNQLQDLQSQLQTISIPNEPLYKVQSKSVNLNFGFLTTKMAEEVTGSKTMNKSNLLTEEENNKQKTNYNTQTNFYKFSMTRYIDNPFYTDKNFPKNSSGYQAVDPKLIAQAQSNISTDISQIKFKFPKTKQLNSNTSLTCITQIKGEEWNAEMCNTVDKDGEITCQCETLNPTSVMESLNLIADKASQVFSQDTLLAFGSFPFYKTIVFYFYIAITCVYIYVVYWGVKVDNVIFEQVHAAKDPNEEHLKVENIDNIKIVENNENVENIENTPDIKTNQRNVLHIPQNTRFSKFLEQRESKGNIESQTFSKEGITIFSNPKSYEKVFFDYHNQGVNSASELQGLQTPDSKIDSNIIINSADSRKGSCELIFKNQSPLKPEGIQKSQETRRLSQFTSYKDKTENQGESSESKGLKNQLIRNSISKVKAYIEYVKFFHQVLQIKYKSDPKKPRGLRASIVYTSILGSLAVLFVFNQPNNLSFTLTLALITAPVNKIYQIILEKTLSHNRKAIRIFGAIFMVISAGLISYVMLAGLVLMDSVETANQWSFIFFGTIITDNLFYCPASLIFQYLIQMELLTIPGFQKLLDMILDEKSREFLYGLVQTVRDEN